MRCFSRGRGEGKGEDGGSYSVGSFVLTGGGGENGGNIEDPLAKLIANGGDGDIAEGDSCERVYSFED